MSESATSRPRTHHESCSRLYGGRYRITSRKRIRLAVSINNWVNARSGARKTTNRKDTSSPTKPNVNTAVSGCAAK